MVALSILKEYAVRISISHGINVGARLHFDILHSSSVCLEMRSKGLLGFRRHAHSVAAGRIEFSVGRNAWYTRLLSIETKQRLTMACSGRGDSILFMVVPATSLAWVRAAEAKRSPAFVSERSKGSSCQI